MSTVLSTRQVTSSRFMFRLQMWHISAPKLRLLWMLSTTAVLWMRRYMIRQCAFCKVATTPVNRFWRLFWKLHRYRPVPAALFCNCRFPGFMYPSETKTCRQRTDQFACYGAFSASTVADKACFNSYLLNFRAVIEHFSKFTSADLVIMLQYAR